MPASSEAQAKAAPEALAGAPAVPAPSAWAAALGNSAERLCTLVAHPTVYHLNQTHSSGFDFVGSTHMAVPFRPGQFPVALEILSEISLRSYKRIAWHARHCAGPGRNYSTLPMSSRLSERRPGTIVRPVLESTPQKHCPNMMTQKDPAAKRASTNRILGQQPLRSGPQKRSKSGPQNIFQEGGSGVT